jgi:hypothetical protein
MPTDSRVPWPPTRHANRLMKCAGASTRQSWSAVPGVCKYAHSRLFSIHLHPPDHSACQEGFRPAAGNDRTEVRERVASAVSSGGPAVRLRRTGYFASLHYCRGALVRKPSAALRCKSYAIELRRKVPNRDRALSKLLLLSQSVNPRIEPLFRFRLNSLVEGRQRGR